MTHDQFILNSISGMKLEFKEGKFPPTSTRNPHSFRRNSIDNARVHEEIRNLQTKNVIEQCSHVEGEFISNVFPRPKKNGGIRLILDLSELNKYLVYRHFKMDNIHKVLELISPNNFLASVDLRDAYYSVPVHDGDRKFLRFTFSDQCWQFKAMPNGLSSAPRLFTKILKPVFATLRRLGHIVIGYLDDTILISESEAKLKESIATTVSLLTHLGFVVHPEKSVLYPTRKIKFLGFMLDTVEMSISLPEEKMTEIRDLCANLLHMNRPSIRQVARVIGKIVASFPAVQYGPLFYRELEKDKIQALKANKGHFDRKMELSTEAKQELQWWVENIHTAFAPIQRKKADLELRSDASGAGWGATNLHSSTGGRWSEKELHNAKHSGINYLELVAAGHGLKSYCKELRDVHVLLRVDNTTAVAYLNNMGGVKSPNCNDAAKEIWKWCIQKHIWITASHIPGKLNVEADHRSRQFNDGSEWMLNPAKFQEIASHYGTPEIDLFASRLNKQVERYVAWQPDPEAENVDAFTLDWGPLDFYAFPPFCLISRCLQKIRQDKAKGIVVVPNWPTQPWFPVLMSLTTERPMLLRHSAELLTLPGTGEPHPLHDRLDLLCFRCCENP